MRIKKSKLLFFFYAIIMLWPEYFSNSLTGLMANALALVGLLFVFKNLKRISRFSILAAVYFVYFVVDTYFHGGGDIHTLISNMKIVISIMFVDVYLTKEDQYDTISTIFWIVFFFAMLNFATLLLFPNGMYQISTVWNEWGTTTYALYWIFGSKNSHAFWYLQLEILVGLLYALTVVTILAYVTEGPVHPLYYIYTLTVKNRVPCIITLLGGVLNVVGMFVLVRYTNMGIYSIVITTTIITTITSMITNPPYIAHCLKLKWYTFYPMLLINIIGSVIMTVLFGFVEKAIAPSTWVGLIVTACILSILGFGIYFIFVFSNKERKYIINMVKRKANIKQ